MHRVAADRAGAGGEHVALAIGKLSGAVPRQRRIVLVVMGPDAPDGRLAGAGGADRGAPSLGGAGVDRLAVAVDRARAKLERGAVADELAPFGVVGVGEQRLDRDVDEFRVAVEGVAIGKGELRRLDLEVDEIRSGRIEAVEVEALERARAAAGSSAPGSRHRISGPCSGRNHSRSAPRPSLPSPPCRRRRARRDAGWPEVSITSCVRQKRSISSATKPCDHVLRARSICLSRSPPALSASRRMRS